MMTSRGSTPLLGISKIYQRKGCEKMKLSELENYIRERVGDQSHRFDLYRDMTQLILRYRWIGDKLFDMDPENPLAPCFLSNDDFLLFALEPSVERLRFFRTNGAFICPDIFKKLVESNRNLPWDDAYDYVDDSEVYSFKYLNWFLRTYRDELLKIDESIIPKGKRLITHHNKSYAVVKSLLEDYLTTISSPIKITKRDMETAMSRYRWFGDEVLDIYKSNPRLLCEHNDARFLLQILYPDENLIADVFQVPDGVTFYDSYMSTVKQIKYGTPADNRPWSQIWGYVKSRPTSISGDVRNAIKLQFRNQSYYNVI